MDNFRAAWEWASIHREFAMIEQTLRSIWMLYDMRGWFHGGLDALGRAIAGLEASHEHTARWNRPRCMRCSAGRLPLDEIAPGD
jgi:hypothetical protein